ncbi:2166_t:CDS:2 [Paraglomus occultum]|uniref:2166_t:CDS:1 n=1 Tax=Paraglomus occultum TaxID=144539 RepID=A0A9N9ATC0_9GLOM|nr:2166_t:CDS:2 [Paraglomus occultum]
MGRLRRSRVHKSIRDQYRKYRTRNYAKDIDQIHEELKKLDENEAVMSQELDEDLPGGGQFHCVECARHFISAEALGEHKRGKNHKKRVKLLKEQPYTQAEAEAAVGYTTENARIKLMEDVM